MKEYRYFDVSKRVTKIAFYMCGPMVFTRKMAMITDSFATFFEACIAFRTPCALLLPSFALRCESPVGLYGGPDDVNPS